jgi:hypothetical protein
MSQYLTYRPPVNLTGRVIQEICERIEGTKPVAVTDDTGICSITYKDGVGSEFKFNVKKQTVQVCKDGSPVSMTIYTTLDT